MQWIDHAVVPNKEAVVKSLLGARDAMIVIRNLMRQMGKAAGVPVSCSPSFFNFRSHKEVLGFYVGIHLFLNCAYFPFLFPGNVYVSFNTCFSDYYVIHKSSSHSENIALKFHVSFRSETRLF